MLLQYLKKEVRDEVDFLHANKHQSFLNFNTGHQSVLQGDTIIIDGHDQAFSKYSTSLQYLYIITRKKSAIKFCNKNMINEIFTSVIKYFSDAKHSDISRGSGHVFCYLFTMFLLGVTNICSFVFFVLSNFFEHFR